MTQAARLSAALLLAVLALVSPPNEVEAQNTRWELSIKIDPVGGYHRGWVKSQQEEGGAQVEFSCKNRWAERGFRARIRTQVAGYHTGQQIKVEWRKDGGDVTSDNWIVGDGTSGVITADGQTALRYALAVARAKKQIELRTPKGTVVFGVKGAAESIRQLAELCSITSANNSPWKFVVDADTSTGEEAGFVHSSHVDGGMIGIFCEKGESISVFNVIVATSGEAIHQEGPIRVSWRIDEGEVRSENWKSWVWDRSDSFANFGEPASEFALAIARAQNRIVFQTTLVTKIYNAIGAETAISELFEYCGLPQ